MFRSIALVDDDRNILTSVSIALEADGFEVNTYVDGTDAIRGLAQKPADLAILDIKMPRMDGLKLLAKIRETSSIPVIFLTSKDHEIDEVLRLRMGADDYIMKPFYQRLLIERVKALLRRRELDATILLEISLKDRIVKIRVIDQGPGLQTGTEEDIFDRFYSERPKNEKFGIHSGLGLSISQQIVMAHGGNVWAENLCDKVGKITGACFIDELPTVD